MKSYAIRRVTRNLLVMTFVCMSLFCLNGNVEGSIPTGVKFDQNVFRSGNKGDNWCMTWAADGDIYTSMCDGRGWLVDNEEKPYWQNNQVIRLSGTPGDKTFRGIPLEGAPDYSRMGQSDIISVENLPEGDSLQDFPGKNKLARKTWTWYAYGIASIDGNLYQFISHTGMEIGGFGWFDGVQLIWKPKGDKTWERWNGTSAHDRDRWLTGSGGNQLLFHNEPNYAFSFISVVQYGKDYQENKDGYVYLYSPNGKKDAHRLNLARVKKEHILDRTNWEYFARHTDDGDPEWVMNDIHKRGDVHLFPEGWGFYSWLPSVVWNKELELYIMACAGTQRPGTGDPMETYMHHATGGLKFLWAKNPWGPWYEFYYDEVWDGDHKDNRLYLPQISPKWISDDGKSMYLIYSDAGYSYGKNYRWNCQRREPPRIGL